MKSIFLRLLFCLLGYSSVAQDLSYYLPAGVTYDPSVPKPSEVIYQEVGEWHVTHDRLVSYLQALARAVPQRIQLVNMGKTYEGRPQILMIITSLQNQARLEQIREQHVLLSDPVRSASLDIRQMPAVLWIGSVRCISPRRITTTSITEKDPPIPTSTVRWEFYLSRPLRADTDSKPPMGC